jgi:tetratricopeptide (TPR) repeat protein
VRPSSAGAARAPSSGAAQPSSTSAYFPSSYNHGTDQDAASAQASAPVPVTPPQPKALSPEAQALREQGNVLFQSKRYADAADAYDRALRLEPSNELLLCNRAAALLLLHRYAAAMRDSQRAAQLDPALVKAHWRAAKAALFLGAGDSARRHYSEAQRLAASQPDAESIAAELRMVDVAERARRSLDHREWAEALRCCEQLLRVFPPSSPCAAVWRCLQVEATVATDAARALELAVATSDGDPLCSEAWYQRARCVFYTAHDANATASALGFLRRCREQEPEMGAKAGALQAMIEAFARLRDEGNAAYAAGRWAEAHAAYTRCLGVDAHNGSLRAIILCNRAAVHIQRDAWGDALDDIDASIRLNPTNAKAYTRRARVQQHFGRHEAVVRDLQTAAAAVPQSREPGAPVASNGGAF